MRLLKNASFSITALLLMIVLAASFLSNYMLRRELEHVKVANRNMANQLLASHEITDSNRVHWGQIELPTKMMWRFRVFMPPGQRMKLNYAIAAEKDGFPSPMRSFDEIIEGSDQLQTITIQIRQMGGTMVKIDAFINGSFAHGVGSTSPKSFAWLDQLEELTSGFQGAAPSTWPNLADSNEDIVLLKKSETDLANSPLGGNVKIAKPPNQFIIWLEPVE